MLEIGHTFESIVENLEDGIYFVDKDRKIIYWNKAAERITGFLKGDVVGHSCADNLLVHVDAEGREVCHRKCPLSATMKDGEAREEKLFLHHRDGHLIPVILRVSPLRDDHNHIIGGIELFAEMDTQMALRRKISNLERLVLLDPLTGLANRREMTLSLSAQFALRQRLGIPFGVLFIDIDHFKEVNDTHGHPAGDLVLQAVGRVLFSSVRPFDKIGRWGGEEFLGLFPNTNAAVLAKVAERLCTKMRAASIKTPQGDLAVTVSIGGTILQDGDSPDGLLKRADEIMYRSKQTGRNRVTIG